MASNVLLSICSGILLALSFPGFGIYGLAWVALAPFFLALGRAANLRQALACGLFFGLAFFGLHLFWITELYRFVEWWVAPALAALVLFQTSFILIFVIISRLFLVASGPAEERLLRQPAASALVGKGKRAAGSAGVLKSLFYVFALAAFWVLVEWVRALGAFGVSAGNIGYTQAPLLPLIQIASYTTVYGVSFLLALFNAALALFISDLKRWQPLVLAALLVLAAAGYGFQVLALAEQTEQSASLTDVLRGAPLPRRFALVQPNIDQKDKLNPALVPAIFDIHEEMTKQAALDRPEIIIWPETAIFSYLLHDARLLPRLRQLAKESKAWIIFGTPHYAGGKAYNSIVSMSPQGEIVSRYDKQQLVPFGEYLPFRKYLYPMLKRVGYYDSEFSPGAGPRPITAAGLKLAAAVCFESTFPELMRERVAPDSGLILLVTNDAWFGDSSVLDFHLSTAVFRAVENRKYFIQAGNTGYSALIDPYGRILERSEVNQRQILIFELPLGQGQKDLI